MLDLIDELRGVVRLLEDHGIEYALCGGMAMGVHGSARATIDIDLLILSESLNEVFEAVKKRGYAIRGKDLSLANGAVEIRRVSKIDSDDGELLTLDLLLVTPETRGSWETRTQVEWEGGLLSVVSVSGLVELKQLRNSYQDKADIEALTSRGSHEES